MLFQTGILKFLTKALSIVGVKSVPETYKLELFKDYARAMYSQMLSFIKLVLQRVKPDCDVKSREKNGGDFSMNCMKVVFHLGGT